LAAMDDEKGKGVERAQEFSLDKIVDQYLALIKELEQSRDTEAVNELFNDQVQ